MASINQAEGIQILTAAARSESDYTPKEHYEIIWNQVSSEGSAIQQKLNALISSQAFLFMGYVSLLNSPENLRSSFLSAQHIMLLWIFPIVALCALLFTYFSMITSFLFVYQVGNDYRKRPKGAIVLALPPLGGGKSLINIANLSTLLLPLIFCLAWVVLMYQQMTWKA